MSPLLSWLEMERRWSCCWGHSTIRLAAADQFHRTPFNFLHMFAYWKRQMHFKFSMLICFHFFLKTWFWSLIFAFYRDRCTCIQILGTFMLPPKRNTTQSLEYGKIIIIIILIKLLKWTWNEVAGLWETLLETCVTVDSANNNGRWKFLLIPSLWKVIKCETEKQYYYKPRHRIPLRNSMHYGWL